MKFANERHRMNTAMQLMAGVKVFRKDGRELTLDDVLDGYAVPNRHNSPAPKNGPRDFAGAIRQERAAGADVDAAIRLARKNHPELYRSYCNELLNPVSTTTPPEPKGRKLSGKVGFELASAIQDELNAGKGVDAAGESAIKANPAAYDDYVQSLKTMVAEGGNA